MTKSAATEARLAYLYRRTLIVDGQWYLVTEIYGLARRYPVIAVSEDGVERAFEEHFAVQSVAPGAPTPRTSEECACVPRIVDPAIGGLDREAIYAHYDLADQVRKALPEGWMMAVCPGYYRPSSSPHHRCEDPWILGLADFQYDLGGGETRVARYVDLRVIARAMAASQQPLTHAEFHALVLSAMTGDDAPARRSYHFGLRHGGWRDGRRPTGIQE